jgi:glutathione S-transferase
MKLYYAPGACSLADHIALIEAGIAAELVKVDLKTKRLEDGGDYMAINPKGYVPALQFDDGQVLTENIAVLGWIAERAPQLAGPTDMMLGRARLLELLAYISTELHKGFKPFFSGAGDAEKQAARAQIEKRLAFLAGSLQQGFVLGSQFSVADAYLVVMLRWAAEQRLTVPIPLAAYLRRLQERPSIIRALAEEGLSPARAA